MTTLINASTSAGLVQTADTTGNLSLQSNGTTILALTSAGAAVTGTLSATGLTTLGASTERVQINRLSDFTGYGLITLNGLDASTTASGMYGRGSGGDSGKLFITGIGSVVSQIAGVTVTSVSSTGLAVTAGELNLTGSTHINLYMNAPASNKAAFIIYQQATTNKFLVGVEASESNYRVQNGSTTGVYLVSGNTTWTANSDERIKDITGDFVGALDHVRTVRTVRGTLKSDETKRSRSFLIAQDWQEYLPEAIELSKDILGLTYTDTIPVAFAAIKELIAKNEALEARLAALEAK